MSNTVTVGGVYTLLASLEKAALASTDARVKAFGASLSTSLEALKDAAPALAVAFVNAGIAELVKAEPIFGLLLPAEVLIDPAVSGLASAVENMLLHGRLAMPAPQPDPQLAAA